MNDIRDFIPQRQPFVMVDEILKADEQTCITKFIVRSGNVFVKNAVLTEPAFIENIAQTAAAHTGYLYKQENEPVPVGFIGAVQQLGIFSLPEVGDAIETEIVIKNQVLNATIISGSITCNHKPVAKCEMKIFIQSDK